MPLAGGKLLQFFKLQSISILVIRDQRLLIIIYVYLPLSGGIIVNKNGALFNVYIDTFTIFLAIQSAPLSLNNDQY